jgi:hypothetical protein
MDNGVDRRQQALRGIGIALVAAGVATHLYEQRMLRVRLATAALSRRAAMALDDPGVITSTLGLAALAASRRFTRQG